LRVAHSDSNANGNAYTDRDGDGNCDTNANRNAKTHTKSEIQSNATLSPYSVASPVASRMKRRRKTHADGDSNSYTDFDTETVTDGETGVNTEAASHAVAATVGTVLAPAFSTPTQMQGRAPRAFRLIGPSGKFVERRRAPLSRADQSPWLSARLIRFRPSANISVFTPMPMRK
jgi:hypothetical protein